MAFAHIGLHADHIHYRTRPREDYSVGGTGWFGEDNETPKDAVARYARNLESGESVLFPYREETLRDLVSFSPDVVVTSDDPRILERIFGGYEKSKNPWIKYFTVIKRNSPWGAGIQIDARAPRTSHESLLHKFAARLLGYPADVGHHEHGEPVSPPPTYPTEWEQVPTGGNTIMWKPAQPKE